MRRARRVLRSVVVGGLAIAEMRRRRLDDLGEADHRHLVVLGDRPAVDLLEEAKLLLQATELGVVVLDVAPAEIAGALDLDVVDHRGEDLLALAVAEADRDPDDLTALVLVALVAEPDGRGLAAALELVDEDRGIEVQDVDAASHEAASVYERTRQRGCRTPRADL